MNLIKIEEQLNCYKWIKEYNLPWQLPKLLDLEILKINKKEIESIGKLKLEWIKAVSDPLKILIVENIELLKYISILITKTSIQKIENLLEQVDSNELLSFNVNDVIKTLNDSEIPQNFWSIYLEFYIDMKLCENQKEKLWKGLQSYYQKEKELKISNENKMLFYTDIFAKDLLSKVGYKCYIKILEENPIFLQLLELISNYHFLALDGENMKQLLKDSKDILCYLDQIVTTYLQYNELTTFITLWLENHNLLYDLKVLNSKIKRNIPINYHDMIENKVSYISTIYSKETLLLRVNKEKEEILIYAIANKKRAFLTLINENFELFNNLSIASILFNRNIYTKLLNLNSINLKDLKAFDELKCFPMEQMEILEGQRFTFDEIAIFSKLSKDRLNSIYLKLYISLKTSIDKKIIIIREIIKKKCLSNITNIEGLSSNLSIKPLSFWMQKEFGHIVDIDATISINLLEYYQQLSHLIPDIKTVGEARYIIKNKDSLYTIPSMKEVENIFLNINKDWLQIKEIFNLTPEFIQKYEKEIKKFIYKDGAHIILSYYEKNKSKREPIRRLLIAELMGRFHELKYYKNDLQLELDYPINHTQMKAWVHNLKISKDNLTIWEEDAFLPVMQLGVIPQRTCLSYIDGSQNQCLLACHDANKKVLYGSYQGKIIFRASIRLTKGSFRDETKKLKNNPKLEFIDLEKPEIISNQKEYLTLFLERPYIFGLSQKEMEHIITLVLELMQQKSKELQTILIISRDYQLKSRKNIVSIPYSLYISTSKAGEQYLDSLGGSCGTSKEGQYYNNIFYNPIKEI